MGPQGLVIRPVSEFYGSFRGTRDRNILATVREIVVGPDAQRILATQYYINSASRSVEQKKEREDVSLIRYQSLHPELPGSR